MSSLKFMRKSIFFIVILVILFTGAIYSQSDETTELTNNNQTIPLSIKRYISKRIRDAIEQSKFEVRGGKTVTIENNSFSGDERYRPPSAYTPYRRIETAKFYANGNIAGVLDVEVELISSSEGDEWGFTTQLYKQYIHLRTEHFELEMGDITVNYPYSSLVLNNKNISGIKAKLFYDRFELLTVYSIPKGKPLYDEFYGDGTQGPYILDTDGNFIVEGSEVVKVDNKIYKRGVDYQIDIYSGEIIFLKRSILTTEKINVKYEVMENPFNRKLIGSSFSIKATEFLRTGIDFACEYDDEESYRRASEAGVIMEAKPVKRTIIGLNTDLMLNPGIQLAEYIQIYQEWAYNYKNRDITTDKHRLYTQGYRNKSRIKGRYYDLGLGGTIIGNDYQQIGTSALKEDSYEYGYNLVVTPLKSVTYNGDYYFLKDRDETVPIAGAITNIQQEFKNQITVMPTRYNRVKLYRREYLDNDKFTRDISEKNNRAEVLTDLTNFEITVGGIYNEFVQKLPAVLRDRRIERGGLINASVKNIEWLKSSASFEILEVESSQNGRYKKWRFNLFNHLNYKEKYQLINSLLYSKGEIHTVYSSSNREITNQPSDEVWIVDLKTILNPADIFKNQTHYKINNYKDIYDNEFKEIIQHTGTSKTRLNAASWLFLDYQFDTIFHIRRDNAQKSEWIYRHYGKISSSIAKWFLNRFGYKKEIKNVRLKLEPDKLQSEDREEYQDKVKLTPGRGLAIDLNGYYKKYLKQGYYDIGIDNLEGDHTYKYAKLEELTEHFDCEIRKEIMEVWLIGTFYGITRYQLKDDYKISTGRYYTTSDTTTAAKLSDTDYLETIGGLLTGYKPFFWLDFILNYYRSYLKDITGYYSQKITNIFKAGLRLTLVNFLFNLKIQYDSSYYQAETERPSRTIYTITLRYYYKTNVNITGNINYEKSNHPGYRYITSRINLEINF